MSIFIGKAEKERLLQADRTSLQWKCYAALKDRVSKNTVRDSLLQPEDTQEWYHLCWERISDASFAYYMEPEERLGKWLHARVMEIVEKSPEEWIGPWYRRRCPIPEGYLETAHITLAVCEAVENCPSLFSTEERNACLKSIREKGMFPCMRFCRRVVEEAGSINNWFMVTLNGFGTAAVLLQDMESVRLAVEWSHVAAALYNKDSYGESVQYSNYASLHLSHLNEVLIRSGLVEQKALNLQCYTNLMNWYAASFLYCKPLRVGEPAYPRTINFGDSAAIFRPSGDLLVQVAVRTKDQNRRAAGLASWLFQQVYADPALGPDELATFGFFNQYQYFSVLMLPDCPPPISPREAGLPTAMSFEGGQIILRDSWENTKAVVALQAGYRPYHVTAHRHRDQNSFQLVIGGERMLVDPGHCCYRLNSQREAVSELAHNTISLKRDGSILEQRLVGGNIFQQEPSGNRLLADYTWGNVHITASDMAGLHDDTVEMAVRIWILKLPHQMATVDIVKTREDMSLCTHFCVNNRDSRLLVHQYSEQRLVLRRGGQALKLFEMFSSTDGVVKPAKFDFDWTAMHTYYHPLPNQAGQGKEGSVCRYRWEDSPGREHIRIHTYAMDTSEAIIHWHVRLLPDDTVRMENPTADAWLDIKADMEQVILRNEHNEKERLILNKGKENFI